MSRARFREICERTLDERAMRVAVLAELRRLVPFDANAWLLTDPETEVGTSPVADIPSLERLPTVIRAKYLTARNRWTGLRAGEVRTLAGEPVPRGERDDLWSVAGEDGATDIASTALRDPYGCWGFLDVWRIDGTFGDADREVLAELAGVVTPALRAAMAETFTSPPSTAPRPHAPAVVLLSDDLRMLTRTEQADADLRAVLPTEEDRAPVPASALNVAAQLLANEAGVDDHPPTARVHLGGGRWCTFGAARLGGSPADAATIAVSIEPIAPPERTTLYARAIGLTARETDVLRELVRGSDTRVVADRLFVSPNTVQDHLKSVFAKAGVRTRPALVARASGAAGPTD